MRHINAVWFWDRVSAISEFICNTFVRKGQSIISAQLCTSDSTAMVYIIFYITHSDIIYCCVHNVWAVTRCWCQWNLFRVNNCMISLHCEMHCAHSDQTTWILCYKQHIQTFSSCFSSSVVLLCRWRLCRCKFLKSLKLLLHKWHLYVFSPAWTLRWFFKLPLSVNALSHQWHLHGLSPVWTLMCFSSLAVYTTLMSPQVAGVIETFVAQRTLVRPLPVYIRQEAMMACYHLQLNAQWTQINCGHMRIRIDLMINAPSSVMRSDKILPRFYFDKNYEVYIPTR